jgi:hypothetical protein
MRAVTVKLRPLSFLRSSLISSMLVVTAKFTAGQGGKMGVKFDTACVRSLQSSQHILQQGRV